MQNCIPSLLEGIRAQGREQAKIHMSIHLRTPPHLSDVVTSILQRMELRRRHLLPLLSLLSGESRRGQARWAELLHPFLIVFLPAVAARGEAAAPAGPCPSSSSPTAGLLLSLLQFGGSAERGR
jgi:hypothetical protein